MEDKESLKTSALISQLPYSVQTKINNFLADGVVTTSVVVSSVLLASDQLLRMEELSVGSSPHFVYNSWLQIKEDYTGNVLTGSGLAVGGLVLLHLTTPCYTLLHLIVGLNVETSGFKLKII